MTTCPYCGREFRTYADWKHHRDHHRGVCRCEQPLRGIDKRVEDRIDEMVYAAHARGEIV
jgi:hypothetical protein